MELSFYRVFVTSILICVSGYAASQDYYEPVTLKYKSPRVIIVGMVDNENLDNVVEEQRQHEAKELLEKIRHTQQLQIQELGLKQIPKKFEVEGPTPQLQFNKYITEIQQLAQKENVTVQYKVKVEVSKVANKAKKQSLKKSKSKKFNIPLKKKNMRLSNFEIVMRKLAETNGQQVIDNPVKTTADVGLREVITTTRLPIMKYKPIITRVRPNYAKKVSKPVKRQEFTLQH